MIQDTQRIIDALRAAQPGLRVTCQWPKSIEALPCITVSEVANTHALYRDDRAYMERLEYDVRIFAVRGAEIDELAPEADAAMETLGYTRIMGYDQDNLETRMKLMRYRRYAPN